MLMNKSILSAAAVTILCCAPAAAQRVNAPRGAPPAPFAQAIACRAIAEPQQRLACYDREVAALEAAEATSQIRVVDAQQVSRTRRTLFGLALPDLNIFGGDDDPAAVTEINATIRSATQDPSGKWIFVLDDGARWVQLDSRELNIDPRAGQPIRIRRAAMGSFLANVNRQIAIRVRRSQ
jgi:hypothetical protein